jgi:hypothetical protein
MFGSAGEFDLPESQMIEFLESASPSQLEAFYNEMMDAFSRAEASQNPVEIERIKSIGRMLYPYLTASKAASLHAGGFFDSLMKIAKPIGGALLQGAGQAALGHLGNMFGSAGEFEDDGSDYYSDDDMGSSAAGRFGGYRRRRRRSRSRSSSVSRRKRAKRVVKKRRAKKIAVIVQAPPKRRKSRRVVRARSRSRSKSAGRPKKMRKRRIVRKRKR